MQPRSRGSAGAAPATEPTQPVRRARNQLDVYRIAGYHVGIFREPFEQVLDLGGFELTPVQEDPVVWNFNHHEARLRGRMLNVAGFLGEGLVQMARSGRAYAITRQNFTLALHFPGRPRRLKLAGIRYRVLPQPPRLPPAWPEGLVSQVLRYRFRNLLILDETVLLAQIGLRGTR